MVLYYHEDRGRKWHYWRMLGKVPRFLLSQARSQRVTLLPGARAARDKRGCLRGGGARTNGGPLPSSSLAQSPCGKKPLANAPALVSQARLLPSPRPASHYKAPCHGGIQSRWW